ncbi:FGGY family carbohydrate kinase [Gemmobacter caeruleus]|uniref:FGGY family carbohydrate kinase n=1 Tax=Gemmobacter caeruleus TaxID=2595004 RepID=UPI0011F07B04|nr:glycerol kinase [Gemmobacter caeruleus]
MANKYILAIDAGTTGTRAVIVDRDSNIKAQAYSEFTQFHPAPDRVEHDPEEIWQTTYAMMKKALKAADLKPTEISAIGITNQRSTRMAWNRQTGQPIYPAIVWQDMRNANMVESIRSEWGEKAYKHTGWPLCPLYSSLGLWWMMENVPNARQQAEAGDVIFGNVDAWLIYKLTGGKVHATSASNATVAGYYDLYKDEWYKEWFDFLNVPVSGMPEVRDDSGFFGVTDPELFGVEIPITGNIGDQQSGLLGQGCIEAGSVKCTHGTGTFLNMNVGEKLPDSRSGTNVLIAWRINGKTTYTLEGYASVTGSAVQWLRDRAELIEDSAKTEELARSVADNGGVYFVPAMTGLAAPYWDTSARGTIIGITLGTSRAHLARATLESIVYQTKDFLQSMRADSGVEIKSMRVDGGAVRNDWLMQFQSNLLNAEVVRPTNPETTVMGAAYMAGLASGYWSSFEDAFSGIKVEKRFKPRMEAEERERLYGQWTKAVHHSRGWINNNG